MVNMRVLAQIPNPGFELVTSSIPNGWNLGPVYSLYPIRDTAVSHTGSHGAAIYGSIPPTYNGAVVQNFVQSSGLPLALTGWYRFYPQGGDSILFDIEVWKQGNYATKAKNTLTTTILTGTTTVYTQFSVAINYIGYGFTNCDSAFISIYPTGNVLQGGYNWAHPNTIAVFDDLAWTYNTTDIKEISAISIVNIENASPSPTKDFVNITYTLRESEVIDLKLYDMFGKEVLTIIEKEKQSRGRYKAIANLSELTAGVYTYVFTTSGGSKTTKKLIKE